MKRKRGFLRNGAIFSLAPVEYLSMQITSCLCLKKPPQKCEPIKPAPPVTRYLAIATPYRVIFKAASLQVLGLEDVTAVKNHRLFEQPLDSRKIGAAKLVPFRENEQRGRAFERVVVSARTP